MQILVNNKNQEKYLKPWMSEIEIDFIEILLLKLKPKRCLEWGSGYSTIHFPKFISNESMWISVEHDTKWYEKIKKMDLCKSVFLKNVLPNKYPWTDKYKDGNYNDLKDYIEFPEEYKYYDFILIDGRARIDCLRKSLKLICPEGIVVLHDANRKYYHPGFSNFNYSIYLKDSKFFNGGLWLGSLQIDPINYLNQDKVKEYYSMYKEYGKCTGE